jgi:hypothetical protein
VDTSHRTCRLVLQIFQRMSNSFGHVSQANQMFRIGLYHSWVSDSSMTIGFHEMCIRYADCLLFILKEKRE